MKRTNRTLETLVIALLAMAVQTVWADEVMYINAAGKTATHDAIILDGTESSLGQQARQFVLNFGDDSEGTGIISVSK